MDLEDDHTNPTDAALDDALGKWLEIADAGSGALTRELPRTAAGCLGDRMDEFFTASAGDGGASLDKEGFKRAFIAANGDASPEELAASVKVEIAKLIAANPDAAWTAACGKVQIACARRAPCCVCAACCRGALSCARAGARRCNRHEPTQARGRPGAFSN